MKLETSHNLSTHRTYLVKFAFIYNPERTKEQFRIF